MPLPNSALGCYCERTLPVSVKEAGRPDGALRTRRPTEAPLPCETLR